MTGSVGESIPFKSIYFSKPFHKLEQQPDFPAVDLTKSNAHVLTYMLKTDFGSEAHADDLKESQRQLHLVATKALRTLDLAPNYDENEYQAFTQGFATLEAVADIVRSRGNEGEKVFLAPEYNMDLAVRRTEDLFVGKPNIGFAQKNGRLSIATTNHEIEKQIQEGNPLAPYDLGAMYDSWCNERPNTYSVILDSVPDTYPTLREVRARIMGARVAYQLQLPVLAA